MRHRDAAGQLTNPQFSPNGREVAFRDGTGRLEVSTVTGVCVWCLTSLPQVSILGTSLAFTRDGTAVTYVHDGLWEVTPGSPHPVRLSVVGGPVTAAVWSASGTLAARRRGWLWTGVVTDGKVILLKRLTRGSAPEWSPDGGELAFTHQGFVSTIRIRNHEITRIAQGRSPAFSPSGRELAYLDRDHRVAIRSLSHGRTRTVTRLSGRSLDWQPVTTVTKRGCAAANGAVVASTRQATIRAARAPGGGHIGWNGCLTALGVPFHLNGGLSGYGYDLNLGQVALAGDYAALQFVFTDKYMDYSDTINVYDLRSGALVHSTGIPCPGSPCDVTSLTVNAAGFAAWDAVDTPEPPERNFTAISCPTSGLCVAGDQQGTLFVSTAPSGGRSAWAPVSAVTSSAPISGVSCPTTALCVAVTTNGAVYWSTDPTAGAAAWHALSLGAFTLQGVSCASVSLCVAVGGQTAYTATDPTGPASAWRPQSLSSVPTQLDGVSCPSSALCVIGDSAGDALTSQDPADPEPSWTATHLSSLITAVDCPTTGLCAAGSVQSGGGAAVLTTTDPVGGASVWTAHVVEGFVTSVTCAGASLCLAADEEDVLSSSDPSDPTPAWSDTTLGKTVTAASCPASNLCVAVGLPDILTSTDPTAGPSAWNRVLVDALACDPCLSETLTAVDDHGARTLDAAPPGAGTLIADLRFSGDTLTWTHDGAARQAGLS